MQMALKCTMGTTNLDTGTGLKEIPNWLHMVGVNLLYVWRKLLSRLSVAVVVGKWGSMLQ